MDDCKKYSELISCLLDGELSEADRAELEAHIKACRSCADLLEAYKRVSEAFDAEPEEVPPELGENVMRRIKELNGAGPEKNGAGRKIGSHLKRLRIARYGAVAACGAILLIAAAFLPGLGKIRGTPEASTPVKTQYSAKKEQTKPSGDGTAAPVAGETNDNVSKAEEESGMTAQVSPKAQQKASASGGSKAEPTAQAGTQPETGSAGAAPRAEATSEPGAGESAGTRFFSAAAPSSNSSAYYATVTVTGKLPDILSSYEMADNGGGEYRTVVSAETAQKLIGLGYSAVIQDKSAKNALVIYRAE